MQTPRCPETRIGPSEAGEGGKEVPSRQGANAFHPARTLHPTRTGRKSKQCFLISRTSLSIGRRHAALRRTRLAGKNLHAEEGPHTRFRSDAWVRKARSSSCLSRRASRALRCLSLSNCRVVTRSSVCQRKRLIKACAESDAEHSSAAHRPGQPQVHDQQYLLQKQIERPHTTDFLWHAVAFTQYGATPSLSVALPPPQEEPGDEGEAKMYGTIQEMKIVSDCT